MSGGQVIPGLLGFLPVGAVLLKKSDHVLSLLRIFQSRKQHLGTVYDGLRVCEIFFKCCLIPRNAGVLVGCGIVERRNGSRLAPAQSRSKRPEFRYGLAPLDLGQFATTTPWDYRPAPWRRFGDDMLPHWPQYLDLRVPRYTSYPTAAQFAPEIDAAWYARWLASLPVTAPVSLYVHVPFCAELCLYCGCHTTVARRYGPIEAYVELLLREIALVGGILGSRPATHLHWGGGTPTILAPRDFQRVMAALRASFTFASAAELAIEIDPRTLSKGHVAVLVDEGITRTSLGVQDFDTRVQRAVNREQSFEQTARVAEWLRAAGIDRISLDLMYGLPYQSTASVEATMQRALALCADRIALFGYAHVPWMKRHQRLIPEPALPGSSERFAQSRAAAELLIGAGYQPIGLDHFAKPCDPLAQRQRVGRLHRNFQGYTTDESGTLIGFGASAIGTLPDGYVQNSPSAVTYRSAIASGRLATARGYSLTDDDRLRRDIIERLMCDLHVDLAERCAAHSAGANRFAAELSRVNALADDGLVERDGYKISIPERARPLVRTVCAAFDVYMTDDDTRFSRAS
jgi:oxygen-independent coproporphyrinogen III oxidase